MEHKYIGLTGREKIFTKRNLLFCQMNLLTSTQKYQRYRKLRKEELALKRLLKKSLLDLNLSIDDLNKYLPHVKEDIFKPAKIEPPKTKKKRDVLQEEINDIRKRIAALG